MGLEPLHETGRETQNRLRRQLDARTDIPTTIPGKNSCSVCGGSGWARIEIGVIPCECRKQKILAGKLKAIPSAFAHATFAMEPYDEIQAAAREAMASEPFASYFLYGSYGRGKTHLAVAQYRKIVELERSAMFFSMAELLTELREAEFHMQDEDYVCLVRERVKFAETFHLFIDDIDKFKLTDFKFEVLFDLVDTVFKRQLGLTVTSNLSLTQLKEGKLHPSIVRRIDDTCKVILV